MTRDTVKDTVVGDTLVNSRKFYCVKRFKHEVELHRLFLRKDSVSGNIYIATNGKESLYLEIDFSKGEGEPFPITGYVDSAVGYWTEKDWNVPAGSFKLCRFYTMDKMPSMIDDEQFYIFAPDVGLIQSFDGNAMYIDKLLCAVINGKYIGQTCGIISISHKKSGIEFLRRSVLNPGAFGKAPPCDLYNPLGKKVSFKSGKKSRPAYGVYIQKIETVQ